MGTNGAAELDVHLRIGYAIASLSCTVGPFLAVTAAGLRGGSVLSGVSVYVVYAAGFTLVVGVLAVAAALASSAAVERMRRIVPYVNRISGALLVVVGVYVGYYGLYEVRLFTGNGNPVDPVIMAAGRVQGVIAGWVHQHGAWPWLVALAVLAVAALGAAWRASATARYRRADRAYGGRRTIATPASVADTSPTRIPIIAMRPASTAGTYDALPSFTTKIPSGLAPGLATGMTVEPSAVSYAWPNMRDASGSAGGRP